MSSVERPTTVAQLSGGPVEYRFEKRGNGTVLVFHGGHMRAGLRLGEDVFEELGSSYADSSWWQEAGPTVFSAMSEDSEHFGDAHQRWSINFRVGDLDAMVAQLAAAGVEVEMDPHTYPNGRFASIQDPEGNPIQLWQPAGADAVGPPPG